MILKDLIVNGIARIVGKVYASGGFVGNLEGNVNGNVTGNAATATKANSCTGNAATATKANNGVISSTETSITLGKTDGTSIKISWS